VVLLDVIKHGPYVVRVGMKDSTLSGEIDAERGTLEFLPTQELIALIVQLGLCKFLLAIQHTRRWGWAACR